MWNRHFWPNAIEVVHFPEFDSVKMSGESSLNLVTMLGFFHGDDMLGGSEVMVRCLDWKPLIGIDGNAVVLQACHRIAGHRAGISHHQCQTPRFSPPTKFPLLSVPIEKDFGEPTAVIISVAEEKNSFHRWCFV